ncbi:unnamed protein product [Closterium sp. NIES-54]
MALRPFSVPLRVPLPPPPESSLPAVSDPEPDLARAASPIVSRLLASVVTDPSFESTAASALVAELVDFAAACRLDYATALVAESESASPPSVRVDGMWTKSTCTYVDEVPPSRANIVDGIWIFRAPREWHDTLRTTLAALGFGPSTADPSLFLRTDTSLPPFYVPVYVDDLVLQRFGFQFSSPQPTPLSTGHSLSAPPSDESVELSGPYPELVGCLVTSGMGLVLGGRGLVVLTGHADASWVDDLATQRSSQGYTCSLGSGSVSWRSTCSSLVFSSSCEAEIYAGAMAAQELRWLTYLLTDLGEQPRSPLVLCVDNKAMISLCQEHRLEHRTKHIALRYFLA